MNPSQRTHTYNHNTRIRLLVNWDCIFLLLSRGVTSYFPPTLFGTRIITFDMVQWIRSTSSRRQIAYNKSATGDYGRISACLILNRYSLPIFKELLREIKSKVTPIGDFCKAFYQLTIPQKAELCCLSNALWSISCVTVYSSGIALQHAFLWLQMTQQKHIEYLWHLLPFLSFVSLNQAEQIRLRQRWGKIRRLGCHLSNFQVGKFRHSRVLETRDARWSATPIFVTPQHWWRSGTFLQKKAIIGSKNGLIHLNPICADIRDHKMCAKGRGNRTLP